MHGGMAANATLLGALKTASTHAQVGVCVPFPYLSQAQASLSGSAIAWGAQDISAEVQGAFTGEVSSTMLVDFGVTYAIVGHSERRQYHAESNVLVAAKALRAIEAGLIPIVCVGETLSQREANCTEAVVAAQLQAVLSALTVEQAGKIVVAYEPIWAIGTGKTASSEQAQAVHAHLRKMLFAHGVPDVAILYGGSVKPGNAAELFAMADIDGGLIGGASLNANDFLAICNA